MSENETALAPEEVEEEKILLPNQITLAKGSEFERVITLSVPRGKRARQLTAKLLPLLGPLESMQGANVNLKQLADVVNQLWDNDKFETEIVPFVLGMEDEAGREYLENLTLMDMFQAFMEATVFIVGGGNSPDFKAAQKK